MPSSRAATARARVFILPERVQQLRRRARNAQVSPGAGLKARIIQGLRIAATVSGVLITPQRGAGGVALRVIQRVIGETLEISRDDTAERRRVTVPFS